MIYKKGSIVPRRLVRCRNRKTQHLWKFGGDVEVIGRNLKLISGEHIIERKRDFIGGKKGKPRIYDYALMDSLNLDTTVLSEA